MDMPRSRTLPIVLSGCLCGCFFGDDEGGRKGVKVKAEFMRVEADRPAPPPEKAEGRTGRPDLPDLPNQKAGPAWSSALSITSLRVPIKRISLHDAAFARQADIHLCSGSGAECQVEAAGAAFQNELDAAPAWVASGEYPFLSVKTCEESEGEFASAVSATVSLEGRAWHTHPTAILDSVGPARPVFVRSWGCTRTYALPRPVRISDSLGGQVTLRLYFDLEEIAYAALGSPATASAWTSGSCAGDRPSETAPSSPPFLCIGYPELSGTLDTVPVSLERYRINGGATLGLFFDGASDRPLGGYLRRYYAEGGASSPGFDAATAIRDLRKNEDGTLYLAVFGGGVRGLEGSGFRAYAFQRTSHGGIFSGLADSAGTLATGAYAAIRLTP